MIDNTAQQKTITGTGITYHSECVFVPRETVWQKIINQYSGKEEDE